MTVILDPAQLRTYCGARGISLDDYAQPRVVVCTTCRSQWDYDASPDWYNCPRGCGKRLDAYSYCATAGRMLSAHCPPPAPHAVDARSPVTAGERAAALSSTPAQTSDVQVEPARRGRPRGSSSVTPEQIGATFAVLQARLGRRPTRKEVAQILQVSADTVDNVLKAGGLRFSELC